jgi:hypothetical protein
MARPDVRESVYNSIDSERNYQQALWGPTSTGGRHSITEFIAYVEDYLAEAKHLLARKSKLSAYPEVLPILRKSAAMLVACMEQNGVPLQREVPTKEQLFKRAIEGK